MSIETYIVMFVIAVVYAGFRLVGRKKQHDEFEKVKKNSNNLKITDKKQFSSLQVMQMVAVTP